MQTPVVVVPTTTTAPSCIVLIGSSCSPTTVRSSYSCCCHIETGGDIELLLSAYEKFAGNLITPIQQLENFHFHYRVNRYVHFAASFFVPVFALLFVRGNGTISFSSFFFTILFVGSGTWRPELLRDKQSDDVSFVRPCQEV